MANKKDILDETTIDGCKVFIEDGEVKTLLSKEIQKNGYIPLETAKQVSIARIRKVIAMDKCGE